MNLYIQRFKKVQKEYPLVTNHINIADKVSSEMKTISFYRNLNIEQGIIIGAKTAQSLDHVEVLIALQKNLNKVLRLLSLQSLVDNGLKAKNWDFLRREILQVDIILFIKFHYFFYNFYYICDYCFVV